MTDKISISDVNWIASEIKDDPSVSTPLTVKIRSQAKRVNCHIAAGDSKNLYQAKSLSIYFESPQGAVASGQSAVLYSGEEVLGGGIIV